MSDVEKVVLVVGASGIVGRAAFELLGAQPGLRVLGASRRAPDVESGTHVPLDLLDREGCRAKLAELPPITHVVYAALQEAPGLLAGWYDAEVMETNRRMLANLLDALAGPGQGALAHLSLLQGTKAYGAHIERMRVPGREHEARHDHANFYWLQEDLLRERAARDGFRFTIWRPPVIYGHAFSAPMNPIAPLATYAAIAKHEGRPLCWPGGRTGPVDAMDARLLARALDWATTAKAAEDEVFNISNGDVFVWENVWARLAEAFGMEVGEPEPQRLAETMPPKAAVWDEVVAQQGLRAPGLMEFVGDSFVYLDLHLGFGREQAASPTLLSTIKLRQAGFADCIDSEQMLVEWIDWMQESRLLPRP
ncbi:MAG: SDR family oxidoreductase [Myxococcota bacterium]